MKNFNYVEPEQSGHDFLDELRKKLSISLPIKDYLYGINNLEQIKKIILEVTFLHEVGHSAFDLQVKDTFLKKCYFFAEKECNAENKFKRYKGDTLRTVIRTINEGFSDTFAAYLTQKHYPDNNIVSQYKQIREDTQKIFKNNISYYAVLGVLDKLTITNRDNIKTNDILIWSIENAIKTTQNKLNDSPEFKKLLLSDLEFFNMKGCFKFDKEKDILTNLKDNISNDLNISLTILNGIQSKPICITNIFKMKNKYVCNNSDKKIKP